MNTMSPIETLRAIGAEAISRQTHISMQNVEKLLAGDLDGFAPVQLRGFVTILEREYDLDLGEWRRYAQPEPPKEAAAEAVSETPRTDDPFANAARAEKRKRRNAAILAGLLLLTAVVSYLVLGGGTKAEKIELNNTAIEKAKANMASKSAVSSSPTLAQADAVQQSHQSEAAAEAAAEPSPVYDDVIIRPRSKVWLGVIDADSRKRQTRTTAQPWRLDGSKRWLIVTGHGYVTFDCGGNDKTYAQKQRLLLLYEEGQCREIDEAEFRSRNRGRIW
jgi:hypothetical protein